MGRDDAGNRVERENALRALVVRVNGERYTLLQKRAIQLTLFLLHVLAAELGEFAGDFLIPGKRPCRTFLEHFVEKGFRLVIFEHEDRERVWGQTVAESVPNTPLLLKLCFASKLETAGTGDSMRPENWRKFNVLYLSAIPQHSKQHVFGRIPNYDQPRD